MLDRIDYDALYSAAEQVLFLLSYSAPGFIDYSILTIFSHKSSAKRTISPADLLETSTSHPAASPFSPLGKARLSHLPPLRTPLRQLIPPTRLPLLQYLPRKSMHFSRSFIICSLRFDFRFSIQLHSLSFPTFSFSGVVLCIQVEVQEGSLVCPETGRRFPISDGIPNMLLNEDEV